MKYPIEIYNEDFYSIKDSFRLLVYIVDSCNYNCEYCYNRFPRTHNKLDLNTIYSFITDIIFKKAKKKFLHLDLIGGETLLHPNLLNFCERISSFDNIFTTVYSNFSFPIEYYKQLLANNIHLLLSWHSCCNTEEFKTKFQKFTNEEIHKHITLSIMYEHYYTEKSKEVFDYFRKTYPDLNELEFSILDENENYNGIEYTQEQFEEFNKRAPLTKTPTTLIRYNDNSIEYVNDNYFFKDVKNTNFKYWMCNAGLDFLYIYHDGTVHPCDENDNTILFNINNEDINKFKFPTKQIFCRREHCPCLFDLYKKKVFNK